jgi:hypothetical protein
MKTITENKWYTLSFKERDSYTGIVKWDNDNIEYRKNGKWHREDGPAIIWQSGYKSWYFKGKRHNLNGPAIIYPDGREGYFIHGEPTTKEALQFYIDLLKLKEMKEQAYEKQ